jgi:tetratricopeptide (TPR) repeat protein
MRIWTPKYALGVVACVLALAGLDSPRVSAQPFPLKTALPPGAVLICDPAAPAPRAGRQDADAAAEVTRLTQSATQAMLLGDLEGALHFLDRALGIDPTIAETVYLRARILQQQGQAEAAAAALCQVLRLEPQGASAQEVQRRLDEARDQGVGERLTRTYQRALALEMEGRLVEAEAAFTEVLADRPATALAAYNRGVVRAALGRTAEARADFRTYLELEPAASDAPAVRGYLAAAGGAPAGPVAGTAFLTGAVVPGGGQFYTGRPVLGAAVAAVAAGAAATGMLYRRTTIRCLDAVASPCPEEMIASRDTERPLLAPALAVTVGVALAAAVEAALHVAGRRSGASSPAEPVRPAAVGGALGRIGYDGSSVRLELVRIPF